MNFEIRPPFIIFHDDKPGQHATLFAPNGERLHFRGDISRFDDAHNSYSWAFEGHVKDGDTIVFAASDREIVGKVRGDTADIEVSKVGDVLRDGDKPVDIVGALLPSIEALLDPPYLESPKRPVPMFRYGWTGIKILSAGTSEPTSISTSQIDTSTMAAALYDERLGSEVSWEQLPDDVKAGWHVKASRLIACYIKRSN